MVARAAGGGEAEHGGAASHLGPRGIDAEGDDGQQYEQYEQYINDPDTEIFHPAPVKDMCKGCGDAGAVSKAAAEENVTSLLPACMAEAPRGMKLRGNAVGRTERGK